MTTTHCTELLQAIKANPKVRPHGFYYKKLCSDDMTPQKWPKPDSEAMRLMTCNFLAAKEFIESKKYPSGQERISVRRFSKAVQFGEIGKKHGIMYMSHGAAILAFMLAGYRVEQRSPTSPDADVFLG